jgi:hypothetical protein
LVPGAGSGDFDSFISNPFETSNQRRESEVRALLDKLRPDMITLPFAVQHIGGIAEPVVEEFKTAKKLLGKKQLKRRVLRSEDTNGGDSRIEKLGRVGKDGKYDALTRFR